MKCLALVAVLLTASVATAAPPKLAVSVPPGDGPALSGRLVIAIGTGTGEPSFTDAESRTTVVVGRDLTIKPGETVAVEGGTVAFPNDKAFDDLKPGEYTVRAALMVNRDLWLVSAPGNRLMPSGKLKLGGEPATLILSETATERVPPDTATHKYLAIASPKLSAFHGRPMKLRVGVVLPAKFAEEAPKTYPVVVHVGGFGQRYTSAQRTPSDARFVQVQLDGAGPFGDPYQVNSAVNGPYGDALVEEVLPAIEAKFRGVGKPGSRYLTGGSTGGWVAVALQVFYPDFFGGAWGQCPDGLDFRAFQLANLSRDRNMYTGPTGFERPAKRTLDGDTVYTVRHECQLERVLGLGGKWELSGQQWASWNATYGPRGPSGLPTPLWDGASGVINRDVAETWAKYDLRKRVESEWPTLGPKLNGKLHVWVGDADDYFLNNAVHRFREMTSKLADPKFDGVIEIAPRRGHESGWGRKRVLDEMAARAAKPN